MVVHAREKTYLDDIALHRDGVHTLGVMVVTSVVDFEMSCFERAGHINIEKLCLPD